MITCKKCGEAHYVKSGFMNGLQRYKCKECGCNFTDTQAAGVPMKTKVGSIETVYGMTIIKSYWKVLWCYSNVSILNWIGSFGKITEEYHGVQDKKGTIWVMELDEMDIS